MHINVRRPKVSIITVVYNGVKTLEETINSVLKQTYPNIEYIIIDGGSSDKSIDIIKSYAEHITHWVSEKDNGIYDAMNKGIKASTGDLIGIINSDDWYEPNAVENVVKAYAANPGIDVFHGLLRFVDSQGNFKSIAGHHISFISSGMIEHPTCFISTKLYKQIGLFDTQYKAAADYDFINRAVKHKANFLFIDAIIANFRVGGITSTAISVQEELLLKYKHRHISRAKYLRWRLILKALKFLKN